MEQIDPAACRRAATLAGLAGAIAAAPAPVDDDDPGSGTPPAGGPPADAEPVDDTKLAGQIAPVIGAEEGVAAPAAADAESDAPAEPPAATPSAVPWKWLAWAAAVAVIALVSRALLRPGSGGRPAP